MTPPLAHPDDFRKVGNVETFEPIQKADASDGPRPFNGHAYSDPPHARDDHKITTFTAAELRRQEFEPIRYVVPGYIAEGCTLLAGRPKLGKSWLVLAMVNPVPTGGTCLCGSE
jgi:hypothetical protein